MTQEVSNSSLRVAARLAVGFALDLVKLSGFGRDVIDGLLLAAISQANVALITRDPDLQHTYASLDQPPPDELRRPVSINAIAGSLRIPFDCRTPGRHPAPCPAEFRLLSRGRRGKLRSGAVALFQTAPDRNAERSRPPEHTALRS